MRNNKKKLSSRTLDNTVHNRYTDGNSCAIFLQGKQYTCHNNSLLQMYLHSKYSVRYFMTGTGQDKCFLPHP